MAAAALEGHFPWSCASVREVGAPGFPDAARKRFRYACHHQGPRVGKFCRCCLLPQSCWNCWYQQRTILRGWICVDASLDR